MSKELKLTPWFPADVKPVRKGVYIAAWPACLASGGHPLFAYWDGERWGWMMRTAERAMESYGESSERHEAGRLAWRGLAVKP